MECYAPEYCGKKDILIANDKIYRILNPEETTENSLISAALDCDGLMAFPALIDQHIHIIGGGGEEGFTSRIKEIEIEEILLAGVTTIVGVLGVDSYTRSLENLLAKARALEEQGLTTFIYTGSYAVPTVTLTKSIVSDIVLIDKIIGTGEVAISDHRSSGADYLGLIKLSSETHLGGLLSGKAGVVHLHIGEGKAGLKPLIELLEKSDLEKEQFVPTHVNRSEKLFRQAIEYCKNGGNIDLTAGECGGITVPNAVEMLINEKIDLSRVTVSSDANGSIPNHGVGKISSLYHDIKEIIQIKNIAPEIAFRLVTENVAKVLRLYPKKGTLKEGSDADILIADGNYKIKMVFCKGKLMTNEQ